MYVRTEFIFTRSLPDGNKEMRQATLQQQWYLKIKTSAPRMPVVKLERLSSNLWNLATKLGLDYYVLLNRVRLQPSLHKIKQ